MVSNGMIQARMQEEIDDLRAEIERMHACFKNLALKLRRGLEGKP
jgi:hypothetical protein